MQPDRWKQIKEILDVSLRLEPGERNVYLTRVCETDPALRDEVESLIEAFDDAGDMLETPPAPEAKDPLIGARLGQYEIIEQIGSGGMGSVYRAARADAAFSKEVAIKVVRRGLDLDYVVRQFRRELQITAMLEHPNIANLIDGGATPDGLPFYVMEFIRGKPIDTYCEEARLAIPERLRIFRTVCAAVQFAHERGVIHRDIKPGNILVTRDGTPKLLDFGIAKLLNPGSLPATASPMITMAPAMTPEYASPEQIAGDPVTTASDVYSLGVLLYELLTGRRPKRTTTQGFRGDSTPEPPSRLSGRRELAGDLDNIVLMAMRNEPERRYGTAGLLADDIGRCLEGQPVRARRDTMAYRASKFVRRQKSAVISAAVAVGLFGAALGGLKMRDALTGGGTQATLVPMTSLPGREFQPAFAPDGKRFAYAWAGENGEGSDIYIQTIQSGATQRVTTDPADDVSPIFSPDGKRIAWLRAVRQETGIFVSTLPSGRHGKIADVSPSRLETVGRHLDWSPDGRFFAIPDRASIEQPFRIVLIDASDGKKRELTLPPERIIGDMSPAFSPDGQSVAFIRALASGVNDVYVAPAAGGEVRRVTYDNRYVVALAWTRDGRSLVFSSERRGATTLWRVPAAGGTPERLPQIPDYSSDPAFSPDGKRMLYTQFFRDGNIWRVDTAGRGPAKKIVASTQYDSSAQYSPDGTRIVFRSQRTGSNEIWVSDSEGRTPVQLTHFGGPLAGTPRWSPDGAWIAFDGRPERQADILVISALGGEPRRVTTDSAEDVVPSWSHDGQWVYFASARTGAMQIWRVRPSGGGDEQVTRLGGFAPFESKDGKYLYYAKGRDAQGLWRKRLPDGVEEPVLNQLKVGFWGAWALVEDGIYFADRTDAKNAQAIFFYRFKDKSIAHLWDFERPGAVSDSTMAVSPDGKVLLFTQVDQAGSDILMLEHFR
jgi:Tol biopolymer transport system component